MDKIVEGEKKEFRGNRPGERRGGRKPGVPNKATTEFRETITKLLSDNAENVALWLERVAADDPDKALQRLAQLAEYAAPKLSRSEIKAEVDNKGAPTINLTLTKPNG